jgi:predicted transcriptional regulator
MESMANNADPFPAKLELQILKILWREGPLRVRDVRRQLAEEGRELAHTTVVTTLNTMADKQFVTRTQEANAYVFAPRVTEEEVSRGMLSDLVDRVFDGSVSSLMLHLLDSEQIDAEEFAALRRLINRKARGKL